MTFCERLRGLREARGRTQSDMARIIGMTAPGYKRLEDGTGAKTFKKIPLIAKALGCRVDDLFPEMDEPTEKSVSADAFDTEQEDKEDESLDCLVL